MNRVSVRDVAIRDKELRYNGNNGYLGYEIKDGPVRCKVSVYDKVLTVDKNGAYKVIEVPEKMFVGYRMRFIDLAEVAAADVVFTALYKNAQNHIYLKRFKIDKTITGKEYSVLPDEKCELLELSTDTTGAFIVNFVPAGKMRKTAEICVIDTYTVKGVSAQGYKITDKAITNIEYKKTIAITENGKLL